MKLLITSGATREPIDAVRYLSNISTGTTGAALADVLTAAAHDVLLLQGVSAISPQAACPRETFTATEDLLFRLRHHLASGGFDGVIMAAAVADYRPVERVQGKISSDENELTLRLVRNEKILPKLKTFSPRQLCVVGFKLTVGAAEPARRQAVAAQFFAGGVDLVVHNDLTEIRAASPKNHPFQLYRNATDGPEQMLGAPALGRAIERHMETALSRRA